MLSVYQHWDPLKICVVGRSYPPEFYSWITVPRIRSLFERIAIETEEDYQAIIKKLKEFNVEVLRPNLPVHQIPGKKLAPPPMTPRDFTVMIGTTFYSQRGILDLPFAEFYNNVKDKSWPDCSCIDEFYSLPVNIFNECVELHQFDQWLMSHQDPYTDIVKFVKSHGNTVISPLSSTINGAMVTRVGKDLYFGTNSYHDDICQLQTQIDCQFQQTRNHIINTGGHADATFCPVCPGLIVSLFDVPTYKDTFPNWEVLYLPSQSWHQVKPFLELKEKNRGRWWVPGFEKDQDLINIVESWLGHWVGYVEETVFDVNMLVIDTKNVLVFNYNKQVFDVLERYGITPHIVPFRHRYFWDGGIHCVTSDLHRQGSAQNYFPQWD